MAMSFEDLKANVWSDIEALKTMENPVVQREQLKMIERKSEELNELLIFSLITERDSFFGNVAIQLNRRVDYHLKAPAAVVFKGTYFDLCINPILLWHYTLDQIKSIYIHEFYHIICMHLPRTLPLFDRYPSLILNLGTDCAINQFIKGLPDGCVSLDSLKQHWKVKRPLEAERESEYYIKGLIEEYKENEEFKNMIDQQQQMRQQGGAGEGGSNPGDSDYDGENGPYEDWEDYAQHHDAWRQSDTSQNMDNAGDVVKSILQEAAAKSRGRIPSEAQSMLKKLSEKPVINWRQQLRKYVGQLSKPYKKTITRKSRRQPHRPDLRGKLNDHVSEIIVAIDTSGSMDDQIISYCMTEVFEILKHQQAKITVIECDCQIARVYEAKRPTDIKPDVKGRGGTSFQPVFDYVKEHNKRNVVVVYFTDGYGEYDLKEKPISYRNLWILTGNSSELSLREPYGEVKELRLDEKWKGRR